MLKLSRYFGEGAKSTLSNKWPSLMASMPKKEEDRGYTQAPKAGEYASLTNVECYFIIGL